MNRKNLLHFAFQIVIFFFLILFLSGCGNRISKEKMKTIEKWADNFQPSAIAQEEQIKELKWFAQAAQALNLENFQLKSVAEDIRTHRWESEVLTQAFTEITGIEVTHEILSEGEVVDKILQQMISKRRIYDIYVNDADMIGTHLRADSALNLSEYITEEGKDVTNPYLDLEDFLNLEFGQDYDGNQLQIPDQQFVNLYWFRYDWFTNPEIQKEFKTQYGYELGVPLNWSAYEDIAEFFTGKTIDGVKVYGHMDYGKKSPSLGWRFTDAWLSIAGVGDKGLPNGLPVDEWGIRVINKIPVGASVERGGAVNGPAAVYALTKYIEWLKKYAPSEAINMTWDEAGIYPSGGNIAQMIFQYSTWLSQEEYTSVDSKVTNDQGLPLWRVAPSPHGKYWESGMKVGYQDAGSWTILKHSVKGDIRKAAWLWAQFCISKSVSLKKFIVGKAPIRKSTVNSEYLALIEDHFGGLLTFYKSSMVNQWTDSGPNVPHYPILSQLWWRNIATAIHGETTPAESMNNLAEMMDMQMSKMKLMQYSPQLNSKNPAEFWLNQPGSPKWEKPDELPLTIDYDELIKTWTK
ncbi:MAG: ABC transporter substrate-binding protein [Spirochaetes bacterium]|nr:ABC transporter substrate-binding protein [Spirochaetota bacterium]